MKSIPRWTAGLLLAAILTSSHAQTDTRQKTALAQMSLLLPRSEAWEKWQQRTGELPPDFDLLPAEAYLPNPLRMADGRTVSAPAQWPERRQELLQLLRRYTLGSLPAAPGNVRVMEERTRKEGALVVRSLTLEFGPAYAAKLYVELYAPTATGPLPVLVVPGTLRSWAYLAASRGYLGCSYAAGDNLDNTAAYPGIWPGADWSLLARRAWAASRVIDFLGTLPLVDRDRIALAGHGVEGRSALITAALDERVKAAVVSSSGVGGVCPFRLSSETQQSEGIEPITRGHPDWFHPRLRFFAGRENKLPVDQNELLACVAPRPCLVATALNDPGDSVWAVEHSLLSAQRVYTLLGKPAALALINRAGIQTYRAEDVESFLDWIDGQFGRRPVEPGQRRLYPTYSEWQQISGERWDPQKYPVASLQGLLVTGGGNPMQTAEEWQVRRKEILERINWGLGELPPRGEGFAESFGSEPVYAATMLGRAQVPTGVAKRSVNFGNCAPGDLYFPAGADIAQQKLPVVIWLHPISPATGYLPGYAEGDAFHIALAKTGFAVFTFDQIGNGQRIEEIRKFQTRYPHSSLMGRTVQEVRSAVDALEKADFINPKRIFVAGYAPGGAAALYAAALDERIAGAIPVAGFTPMRLDTAEKGAGGIARWSYWLPLLPRLGAFVGQEARVPYDFHEIIAAIAPRPVLVMSPQYDYQNTPGDIVECVGEARKVYELLRAGPNLALFMVNDYNRFSLEAQGRFFAQLKIMLQLLDR
jgi:dienelactone hydrolase